MFKVGDHTFTKFTLVTTGSLNKYVAKLNYDVPLRLEYDRLFNLSYKLCDAPVLLAPRRSVEHASIVFSPPDPWSVWTLP